MNVTKVDQVKAILEANGSKLASVTFTKKDGSERTMQINLVSNKGVKGEMASESAKKGVATRAANHPELINVLDMQLRQKGVEEYKCRRSINAETVSKIVCGKKVYTF